MGNEKEIKIVIRAESESVAKSLAQEIRKISGVVKAILADSTWPRYHEHLAWREGPRNECFDEIIVYVQEGDYRRIRSEIETLSGIKIIEVL